MFIFSKNKKMSSTKWGYEMSSGAQWRSREPTRWCATLPCGSLLMNGGWKLWHFPSPLGTMKGLRIVVRSRFSSLPTRAPTRVMYFLAHIYRVSRVSRLIRPHVDYFHDYDHPLINERNIRGISSWNLASIFNFNFFTLINSRKFH